MTIFDTPIRHFNSHAHVERDKDDTGNAAEQENFNSHAHVERDNIVLQW